MTVVAPKRRTAVTWRAVLIGFLLIPPNSQWIMQMEAIYSSAHSTNFSLFFNVVCNLLVLIVVNALLKRFSPKFVFSQTELLTIYIMLNLSAAMIGSSMMQLLPPAMAAPVTLATPENDWQNLFGRYMPEWLTITDKRALEGYIRGVKRGEATLYTGRHLGAWVGPALIWSVFICALMFVLICINVIVRKQWTDRERLTYPVTQLPFEITRPAAGLFKNKLFLISYATFCVINIINGLHFFFPTVPYLRIAPYDLGPLFTTEPWNALGYTPLTFRPFMAGLIFLIPLDMSFSCWFFFFFWKAQIVLGSALGFRQRPEFPEQSAGAYIALAVIAAWMGRRHLATIFGSVIRFTTNESEVDDVNEPLRYRTAVLGIICGFAFLIFFCWKAGMTPLAAGAFFALYLMTVIGVTRVRAEVGSPVHDLHFAGPEYLMVDAVGTRRMGTSNLSILSLFWFLTRAHHSDVMPHQLEGFKLADRAQSNNRGVLAAMLVATVFGTLVAFWAILDLSYRYGSGWSGGESFRRLQGWLTYTTSTDLTGLGYFAYGLLFGIFVMFMRVRFIWWSLHPAGYAVSSTYGMRDWWSVFFFVWLIKWLILKLGGLKVHQQVRPIFFGMVLGEVTIGGFWALFGVVFKTQTFNFTAWW